MKTLRVILLVAVMCLPFLVVNLDTVNADTMFYDNFNDGVADGWTQYDGSWRVANGAYFISVGIVDDGITTVDGLSLGDCTIQTNLRFTDSVGFRSGIIFRFIDSTHYYAIELSNEYDTFDFIKYTPERPDYGENLAQLKASNLFQKDTDYQLKVIVNGNLFRFFINGAELLNATDNSYTHGTAGLRARRADTYFDNFIIENATIFPLPLLAVSCKSSTAYSGFNVQIDGTLTVDENGVADAPVMLLYSINGGKTWQDLTYVYTNYNGYYSATWLPSVTGNYMIKATYEGAVDKLGASSEITNFALTGITEKNTLFSVSSNSTVSSLQFNSTTSELSFTVSGPSGTSGYVKCAIARTIVSNVENIKLFLDGNQLSYDVTSTEDSWILSFTYSHSLHRVSINFPTTADVIILSGQQNYLIWIVAVVSTVLLCVGLLLTFKKRRNRT
jgi:hypothetical protein